MFIIITLFLLCLACCCLPNDVSSSAQIFDAFIFAVRAIVPLNVFLVLMISKLPDASCLLSQMLNLTASCALSHLISYDIILIRSCQYTATFKNTRKVDLLGVSKSLNLPDSGHKHNYFVRTSSRVDSSVSVVGARRAPTTRNTP